MPGKKQKRRPTPTSAVGELPGRVLASLKKRRVFWAGERVGVAVSGGADSVALLLLLLELREELGIVLSVAHLNHKLRGGAADADAEFVEKLAAKHGLEFYSESVEVAKRVRREKCNVEDAARRARQEFFAELITHGRVDRVAVAHTADDQAETVLAHILRGTGLAGLGGIHPETRFVVRPLLSVRRADLRLYLRAKKQTWREDKTNQDVSRTRARIRKKLVPMLERDFQAGVVKHLCALAEFARGDQELLDWITRERCEALAKRDSGGVRMAVANLLAPMREMGSSTEGAETKRGPGFAALTKRIVRRLIDGTKLQNKTRTGPGKQATGQMTALHIAAVLELALRGENGKTLQLPGGVEVRRERDDLTFRKRESGDRPSVMPEGSRTRGIRDRTDADYEYKIDLKSEGTTMQVPEARCVMRLRVIDWAKEREETSKSGAVLDRDRLRWPLVLRNWRPGDRLQPAGHQKARKLKRLLNEKHVSRWDRAGWPVLTSGGSVVWVRGFPVAAGYAADERTREGILIAEEMT